MVLVVLMYSKQSKYLKEKGRNFCALKLSCKLNNKFVHPSTKWTAEFFSHKSLSKFVFIEIILLPVTAKKNMIFKLMEILATLQKSRNVSHSSVSPSKIYDGEFLKIIFQLAQVLPYSFSIASLHPNPGSITRISIINSRVLSGP